MTIFFQEERFVSRQGSSAFQIPPFCESGVERDRNCTCSNLHPSLRD